VTLTWYPEAVKRPITTHEYWEDRGEPVTTIVEHITDGTDSRDFLQNADNGSSVHFLVRVENGVGVVYQFMPIEWAAWGNGIWSENNPYMPAHIRARLPDLRAGRSNINRFTISIEHERKWPFTTLPPAPMMDASIKLQKWLIATVPTIVRDREHIIGHYQIDHIRKENCPGGPGGLLFPFGQLLVALNNASPATVHFVETNLDVAGDFYDFWVTHGGLPIFGYPIRPERVMPLPNGSTIHYQSFERARLERQPGGTITLGLVEVERLTLLGQ
jgi:N-acetyl-anhydromuramyl-L-alanine amidase AmpD